ncbi:MAG: hypothetical protein OHK0048_22990 [Rhodoferax sp.]
MRKVWSRALAALAVASALGGCAANDPRQCSTEKLSSLMAVAEVPRVFDDIALDFCPNRCGVDVRTGQTTCEENTLSSLVLVPDFVSIGTYQPGVAGMVMGEQMRAALSRRCQSRIVQAEFGRDLKLSEDGLVALTRNPAEVVRDEFRGQDLIVGTYAFAGNRLSLFARRVAGNSGVIARMVSKEVVYSCGLLGVTAIIAR